MPEGWVPTDAHRDLAAREGVDMGREAERFRFWAEGKKATSWNGRFSTWLLKAGEDRRAAGAPSFTPTPAPRAPPVPPPPRQLNRMTAAQQAEHIARRLASDDTSSET